jgi:hypothetical protein|tara:strand:+ start:1299 stop:1469 length:171 start_codon:yes stop_codon:yes gene_type:complete
MDTYSEEWRHECEVQHIAKQPLKKRREILEMIAKARGMAEKERLQKSLVELWESKK